MPSISLSAINIIEKKIRNARTFQYIASDKSTQIIEALTRISIRSGMAIYIWLADAGLVDIKSKQTPLPATKTVLEALKYATKNHYFAVYVFPGIKAKDLLEIKSTLPINRKLIAINENTRFLFIIKESDSFNFLTRNAEEIALLNKNIRKYKLRDGKWVISAV